MSLSRWAILMIRATSAAVMLSVAAPAGPVSACSCYGLPSMRDYWRQVAVVFQGRVLSVDQPSVGHQGHLVQKVDIWRFCARGRGLNRVGPRCW
jgi:hypothetical protein